jgi:hypothetical protein
MRTMTTEHVRTLAGQIEAEYRKNAGLRLTRWQIQQLWRLDISECEAILQTLIVDTCFLRRSPDGEFVQAD